MTDTREYRPHALTVAQLAEQPCEKCTYGTCAQDGVRSPNAKHEADRYCWPCQLRAALAMEDGSVAEPEVQRVAAQREPDAIAPWLNEVSQRSREELAQLPPSAQPSWYRYLRGPSAVTDAPGARALFAAIEHMAEHVAVVDGEIWCVPCDTSVPMPAPTEAPGPASAAQPR